MNNNQFCNPWTDEENNILIKMYPNENINKIYKLLPNRTKCAIQQHAKTIGLVRNIHSNKNTWSDDDLQYLILNYSSQPMNILIDRLKRNRHTINEYARRHNLKRPNYKYIPHITHNYYKLAPLLEETPQVYYWLGYLLADGYYCKELSQIVLASAIKDLDHLKKYAKFLNTEAKIYKQSANNFRKTDSLQVRVSVADKYNAELIVQKLDWKKQKTYNPPSSKILSKTLDKKWKLLSLFIGFVDGDGYIYQNKFIKIENHSSWITFLKFLSNRLSFYNIITNTPYINNRGYAELIIGQKKQLQKLKSFILKYNLEVLNRKWDKISI